MKLIWFIVENLLSESTLVLESTARIYNRCNIYWSLLDLSCGPASSIINGKEKLEQVNPMGPQYQGASTRLRADIPFN